MHQHRRMFIMAALCCCLAKGAICVADQPQQKMKVFILAGQSNMVGWGDSQKLAEPMRSGSKRVLMFEQGKWQPLRPIKKVQQNQRRVGLQKLTFGPEIAFAHEIAKAWPDQRIGVIKLAVGGTSILTWKPDWSKQDADRVGQGRVGSLYKRLIAKVNQAKQADEIELAGFLWLQGGGDMKNVAVAKEYFQNLESLVASLRKDTQCKELPFFCGTMRRAEDPDDLSRITPKRVPGRYPAVEWVLQAQSRAQREIPHARTVILRAIETHPMNVHYNTAGQMQAGRLFAKAVLDGVKP